MLEIIQDDAGKKKRGRPKKVQEEVVKKKNRKKVEDLREEKKLTGPIRVVINRLYDLSQTHDLIVSKVGLSNPKDTVAITLRMVGKSLQF
jgi:hypothetical protein